jgi:hypothetical protein
MPEPTTIVGQGTHQPILSRGLVENTPVIHIQCQDLNCNAHFTWYPSDTLIKMQHLWDRAHG